MKTTLTEGLPFGGFVSAKLRVANGTTKATAAILMIRCSLAEALLAAREVAYQRYPPSEGFYDHAYDVVGMGTPED